MTKPDELDIRKALYYFGRGGGIQPGGFEDALFSAMGKADGYNRRKIGNEFPSLVQAWELAFWHGEAALTMEREDKS